MKKTFYRKFGISIIASILLASQLSTVSALTVISNTDEEYEVSETLQESPGSNNFSLPDISPTYGQFFTSQPEAIIGSNDLVSIENTLQYPYSTSVYVESVFHGVENGKNKTYRGSANFIKDNILITAAHNIYKHEFGKDAEELYVTPAATPNNAPFGTVKVKKYYYLKNYVSDNPSTHSKNDLALLVLEEPIGTKTGTLGLSSLSTNLSGLNVTVTGYSALSEAVQMYTDTRNVIRDTGDFLYYNVDTYGGASGAAVYDASHRVVGVHIGNESRGSDIVNLAVKLNEQNLSFIYSILEGHSIDGWKLISGTWYYYKNSTKQTGWQSINGKWYYLETSGSMSTGWKYVRGRWYYLDKTNGDMKTGWYKDGSTWYYLDPTNGDMKTGWIKVGGNWYYLNSSGAMVTGSQTIDGKVYNFASSGEWI